MRKLNQKGYTIVELMIATAVFAFVLLIFTTAILQINRVFYKGVTTANVQNTTRSIIDGISQAIQFNGGVVTNSSPPAVNTPLAFCVGGQRFSYKLGVEMADSGPPAGQSLHVLAVDPLSGCDSGTGPQSGLNGAVIVGRELMSPKMRLSKLSVTALSTNLYQVTVRVVYGDDDLLDNPTDPAAKCKAQQQGTQFCAQSELSTIVQKRVQ